MKEIESGLNDIKKIDILKLNIDGNEFEGLMSAKKLLSKERIKLNYIETSGLKKNFENTSNKVINLLKEYNFTLKKVFLFRSFSLLSNLESTENLFVKK